MKKIYPLKLSESFIRVGTTADLTCSCDCCVGDIACKQVKAL